MPEKESAMTGIEIVDYNELKQAEEAMFSKRREPPSDGYDIWKRYHESLLAVAVRHGKVSNSPSDQPDFYYSGDWFHHWGDGFALFNKKCVTRSVLLEFQSVVVSHHANAALSLGSDTDVEYSPEDWERGLKIFITSTRILVAWYNQPLEFCLKKMRGMGIQLQ
jgi:hypothetical protein